MGFSLKFICLFFKYASDKKIVASELEAELRKITKKVFVKTKLTEEDFYNDYDDDDDSCDLNNEEAVDEVYIITNYDFIRDYKLGNVYNLFNIDIEEIMKIANYLNVLPQFQIFMQNSME